MTEPKYTHEQLVDLVRQFSEGAAVTEAMGEGNASSAFSACAECLHAVLSGVAVEIYVQNKIESLDGDEETMAMFDKFASEFGEGEC